MTAQSTETRLIGTGNGLLPRVNLLPPEIAEKAAFRKVQIGLGSAVLATVGVVGLLFVSAGHSVSSAQADLDTATTKHASLQAEATKYRNVTALYAAADAAQAQLGNAMGDEIRYSQLLNDLSLTVPSNVWFKSLTFAPSIATGPAPAGGAAAAAAPTFGTLSLSGVGFSHDDVAAWLDAVAGLKTYANPYFSNSTVALLGAKDTVTFNSTASLTDKALSKRYKPTGG
jgi:Tfp pilus assembly protein PilN